MNVDADGDLVLQTETAATRLQKPIVYQEVAGIRREVEGGYILANKATVAFKIGAYDHSLPLIIDPVLVYSSFLGGSGDDGVYEVAVDGSGNAFATGYTSSVNFPTTLGAYDTSYNGGSDAFVTKLNSTGTAAMFSTYLGGADNEQGDGIAIDASGNVYVGVGRSQSIFQPPQVPMTPRAAAAPAACPVMYQVMLLSPNSTGRPVHCSHPPFMATAITRPHIRWPWTAPETST